MYVFIEKEKKILIHFLVEKKPVLYTVMMNYKVPFYVMMLI